MLKRKHKILRITLDKYFRLFWLVLKYNLIIKQVKMKLKQIKIQVIPSKLDTYQAMGEDRNKMFSQIKIKLQFKIKT